MKSRICRGCETEKPLTLPHWYSNHAAPDGFETLCKVCTRAKTAVKQLTATRAEKMCATCMNVYPVTAKHFYRRRQNRDGFMRHCIACEKGRSKEKFAGVKLERRESPARSASKFCVACGNMPHRVEGKNCRLCGLEFAEEPRPELQLRRA